MLIRHSLLYILAKLLPGVLGMASTAILTRVLPPEQYGRYGMALVVMTFGSTLAFDWLGLAYLRVAPRHRERASMESTFLHLFAAMVLLTAVLAGLALVSGMVEARERPIFIAGLLMMWSYAWFEFVTRFHVADLRPAVYLRMNIGRALLTLGGACGVAVATRDPVWTAYGTAAATLIGALLGGVGLRGVGQRDGWGTARRERGFDAALGKTVLLFGLPLAASLALNSFIGSGTRALVGWLGSIESLGLYTAAFVLVQNTLTVISAGVSSAGFSLAVRAVDSGNAEAARRQLQANGSVLLAILAPASLGMALVAHAIATTLVGARYAMAVSELTPWMAAAAFFAGFRAHFLDHAFQLGHRVSGQVWVTAVSAVVTVTLDAVLIPRLGPLGAAIAVTCGAVTSCTHAAAAGRRAYPMPLPWRTAVRVLLACAVMTVCVLVMPSDGIAGLLARVAAGVVGYGGAAVALDIIGLRTTALAKLRRGSPEAA